LALFTASFEGLGDANKLQAVSQSHMIFHCSSSTFFGFSLVMSATVVDMSTPWIPSVLSLALATGVSRSPIGSGFEPLRRGLNLAGQGSPTISPSARLALLLVEDEFI